MTPSCQNATPSRKLCLIMITYFFTKKTKTWCRFKLNVLTNRILTNKEIKLVDTAIDIYIGLEEQMFLVVVMSAIHQYVPLFL
jgi:hypothetical protein